MQIEIFPFKKEYSKNFYDLNKEWLKTLFYAEPYDEEVLSNPEKYIIKKDGYIFFAKLNDDIVGTVALMTMNIETTFKLTKMSVSSEHQGQKIGQKLMQYCLDFSKENWKMPFTFTENMVSLKFLLKSIAIMNVVILK